MDRYRAQVEVPFFEERYGIPVQHPRYPHLPKFGMNVQAWAMASAMAPRIRRLIDDGYDFDLFDAHYFYPDGVAASLLAKRFEKPFVVTARGSDINLVAKYPVPRRMILAASERAAGIVAVSAALRDALVDLGVPAEKVVVIRNGVDLDLFKPEDRPTARGRLGFGSGLCLISVGNLVANKGHHLVIESLPSLPEVELVLIGGGGQRTELRKLAQSCGVADRVRFAGRVPQEALPHYYNAADALVLASSREGLPNVLLEALACGTPVIATAVGGIPEVVTSPVAGRLVQERSPRAIVSAIRELFADYPDRELTRHFAEQFGWGTTTQGQLDLFDRVLGRRPAGGVRSRSHSA